MNLLPPRAQNVPRLLLKGREAAEALGISERTLWELTAREEIPVIRIPGRGKEARSLRYDVADLRAWIDRQKTVGDPQSTEPASDELLAEYLERLDRIKAAGTDQGKKV
jgi:predicted DNA-binding transcriptional regulator AlpA